MRNDTNYPTSLADLFLTLTWLALQGFGGVLAVVQQGLVERKRWLTREEFVEEWAVAQIMPGPNVVNLCLIVGARYFGWRGAVVALAGMLGNNRGQTTVIRVCELSRLAVGIFVFRCDGLRQQIQRFRLVVLSRAP